jgi:hypothetical protein
MKNIKKELLWLLIGILGIFVIIMPVILTASSLHECNCSLPNKTPYPDKVVMGTKCIDFCNLNQSLSQLA